MAYASTEAKVPDRSVEMALVVSLATATAGVVGRRRAERLALMMADQLAAKAGDPSLSDDVRAVRAAAMTMFREKVLPVILTP
jgi:hypothetical protein